MPKNSEYYVAPPNKKISNMVKAMKGWNENLGTVETEKPDGRFGRVVIVESGDVYIDGSELDVEFTVPFDDDTEPNEAEITVYNLAQTTISNLKVNAVITITAGYTGDTGIIFSGRISKVSTKWEDLDKVTTIYAIDSQNTKESNVESTAYASGSKASQILRDLVDRLGLPVASFSVKRDHTYNEGVTVDGGLASSVEKYANVCGVSAYINKGKVYVRDSSEGDNIGFHINIDTGLIGSPEEFTEEPAAEETESNSSSKSGVVVLSGSGSSSKSKSTSSTKSSASVKETSSETIHGVKLKMLLEHRITTAVIVDLESKNFSGKYRVREGQHVCTDSDFYTEMTCIE